MPVADLEEDASGPSVIATDSSRTPSDRIAELRRLADQATDPEVQGQIASYIGSLELQRESGAIERAVEMLAARENADIREQLISAGLATPQELDDAGYLSHDELDLKTNDGTLEEAFFGKPNIAFLSALAKRRHRNRGRFADEFQSLAAKGEDALTPKSRTGTKLVPTPKAGHREHLDKLNSFPERTIFHSLGSDDHANVLAAAHAAGHEELVGKLEGAVLNRHDHMQGRKPAASERDAARHAALGVQATMPAGAHAKNAIDVGGDVERAAQLLAQGKHVKLEQPHQVSTLLDRLAEMSSEAERKGDKAPNFDLCKVSVPGTNLFCADTKGYGRLDMPQLSGQPIPGSPADKLPRNERGSVDLAPAFRDHLISKGVKVDDTRTPASHLRATQRELNGGKVGGMMNAMRHGTFRGGGRRMFTSSDDYIVDGHHRWAATVGLDAQDNRLGDEGMDVSQVDMPITDLIDEAKRFSADMGIPPKGIDQHPTHAPLIDNHSLYIKHDPAKHPVVPVDNLHLTKPASSQPASVNEAIRRMNDAANGKGDRRKPIDVIDNGDGTFTVHDGNATTAAAKAGGLTSMPVNVVGHKEPEPAEATRHIFRSEETEGAQQHFGSEQRLYDAAAEVKPQYDRILGEDVARDLGAAVPDDFDKAVEAASSNPAEPQIILAPLKGKKRATEKVETKYDGDWDRLQDVVRGTVVVPHVADMPTALDSIRARAEQHGFTIRKAENRYVDGPEPHNSGPTSQGYRDMSVALVAPNGVVTELQIQAAPMFAAKEGDGHKLYEESRSIEAAIKKRSDEAAKTIPASPGTTGGPTPAELERLAELRQQSEKLYQGAYKESIG